MRKGKLKGRRKRGDEKMKMTAIIIIGVVFLSFIAGCITQPENCAVIANSQERIRCYASNAMITAFGGEADSYTAAAVECENIYSLRGYTEYEFGEAEAMQGAAMCISEVAIAVKDNSVCDYLKVEYFANSDSVYDIEMQRCLEYSSN